jgi:rhodanese-related sulfurtransferase
MNYDLETAKRHFAQRMAFTTGPHELAGMIERKDDIVIVDVRFPADYRKGHVPGAINLPKNKWPDARALSKDKLNVLYCYDETCHMAAEAAVILLAQGYPVAEMEGGFAAWEAKSNPVVTSAPQAA